MELLSKAELKQLVGSGDGGCPATYDECINYTGTCDVWGSHNSGHCVWRENSMIKGCMCDPDGPFGLTYDYSYSYGYGGHF